MGAPDNKPTVMQAKAMELIREGVNPVKAMREAGYSRETSRNPNDNLLTRPGAISLIEQYRAEYARQGITPRYMAKRTKEWLVATKKQKEYVGKDDNGKSMFEIVEQPDRQTQLKAAEFVRKDWNLGEEANTQQTNILIIPGEIAEKYAISSNTEPSSQG